MRDLSGILRWDGNGQQVHSWQQVVPPSAPEECPIAIVIDGMSQAVLMATPRDLRDFALGFALTEGLIARPEDVQGFEEAEVSVNGFPAREARLWLRPGLAVRLAERRRSMIGPVGCGLCGVDSIAAALPQIVPVVSDWCMAPEDVARSMQVLASGQFLRRETPAIHGAAFWDGSRVITREDIGRHNALDKLAGALAQAGAAAGQGVIVMSSRLSVDLVQKTTRIGAPILIGASAPTQLALVWAERAGLTLIARARGESFDLYTHPRRITGS